MHLFYALTEMSRVSELGQAEAELSNYDTHPAQHSIWNFFEVCVVVLSIPKYDPSQGYNPSIASGSSIIAREIA